MAVVDLVDPTCSSSPWICLRTLEKIRIIIPKRPKKERPKIKNHLKQNQVSAAALGVATSKAVSALASGAALGVATSKASATADSVGCLLALDVREVDKGLCHPGFEDPRAF